MEVLVGSSFFVAAPVENSSRSNSTEWVCVMIGKMKRLSEDETYNSQHSGDPQTYITENTHIEIILTLIH